MFVGTNKILADMLIRIPNLGICKQDMEKSFEILKNCYSTGGKVLVCGNGGSAADSEHIVGELMKGFLKKRSICEKDMERLKAIFPNDSEYLSNNLQGALSAISLVSQSAFSTAYINDVAYDMAYAQQVYGYAKEGDVLIGISTSGKSKNIVNAFKVAKAMRMTTIGLTGAEGGLLQGLCDAIIKVPAYETFLVQEYHVSVYHTLCSMIENEFFE